MGAGFTGKVVAVAINERKNTEAAVAAAIAAVGPEDCLLLIFATPTKSDSDHYNLMMKPVARRFEKLSAQLLSKYAALAAEAKVNFQALEVEGNHVREALLRECYFSAVDVLYEARRTIWERLLQDKDGYNYCPRCNPYLRPGGRFAAHRPCHLAHTKQDPCEIVEVSAPDSSRWR